MTTQTALPSWNQIRTAVPQWEGLLVGNGASQAVWRRFSYASLFDAARVQPTGLGLADADLRLFDAIGTRNFEQVMSQLLIAIQVLGAVGDARPLAALRERYESIRHALINAVHYVHVPWPSMPREALAKIRAGLRDYLFVFSTNYDLLIYWAMMLEGAQGFIDYFWVKNKQGPPLDSTSPILRFGKAASPIPGSFTYMEDCTFSVGQTAKRTR